MGPVEKNLRERKREVDEEVAVLGPYCAFPFSDEFRGLPSVVQDVIIDGWLSRCSVSKMLTDEIRLAAIDKL